MSTIISIGGTGAKIVESILHLSACGLLTEARENIRDELKIIFIDPDKSNGNLTRTTETLEGYQKVKKIIKDSPELFNIDIEILGNTVWSPILEDDKKTLANIFGKQRILDTPIYGLFDTLYSIDEQEAKLDDGFLGRPSIGSAIIAQYLDFEAEPWKSLTKHIDSEIGDDGKRISKVFIIGSIFGGTGASGFPTLAKLLKKENEKNGNNFKLGGLLVFPYFRFEASNDPGKLAAKSKYFTITSKIALEYYHNQNFYDNFDALYLIGDNKRELMEKSKPGGAEQKNKANIIEQLHKRNIPYLLTTECDMCPHKDMVRWSRTDKKTIEKLSEIERGFGGTQFFTSSRIPLMESLKNQGDQMSFLHDGCDSGYCFE